MAISSFLILRVFFFIPSGMFDKVELSYKDQEGRPFFFEEKRYNSTALKKELILC